VSFLLDVNALIAGVYEDHEHHVVMRSWLKDNKGQKLRIAPLVSTGCLRVLMTISGERKPAGLISAIRAFRDFYSVEMIDDDIELEQLGKWIVGAKQVTDAHLLAIATKNGLKLVTFDRKIPRKGVLYLE
jgi:predicted nucleic acid-binding protein